MEYRYLGNSGLQVSALSFGAWVTFGSQADVDEADGQPKRVEDGPPQQAEVQYALAARLAEQRVRDAEPHPAVIAER